MSLLLFVGCLCLISPIYSLTNVKSCKPDVPVEVQFGECVDSPCVLKRGDNAPITMTFVADADHAAALNNIFGTMMGIKHGYPGLDGKDACANLYTMPGKVKATCPIQKGQTYLYETVLAIKPAFPKVTVPMHFGIKDKATKSEIACFETVVKIT